MIPYGRQSIDDDDIDAVVSVLKGDWLTQGPHVDEFESHLASTTSARFAVAFANGTAALHAAAFALKVGVEDRLITSPLSFSASANCGRYVGATVGFADIDEGTLNIDPRAIPTDTDALVPVHYAGLPVDLGSLEHRPPVVIEDAAHALGARTPDGPVGNCARSDACCFSFHPVKAITTGEGGAVTTNDPDVAERLRVFRHHGIRPAPEQGGWAYDIEELGLNYRLTDIQAALGTSQLRKLDRFISRRSEIAGRYREKLAHLPVDLPPAAAPGYSHAYHLFAIRIDNRREVFDGLRDRGVRAQVHYVPIYRLSAYAASFDRADFPATERAYARLLSLPLHPNLTEADQDVVIRALEQVLS